MQLIRITFSFLEILRFFSVVEIYIKMSEILKFLAFRMNFTNASTSDVHTCVKVCTWCFPYKMHHAFTYPLHYQRYSLFYRYNLFIWGGAI